MFICTSIDLCTFLRISVNMNSVLKCYYEENRIFSIKAVLKHKQVACMRRKMPFTIF